MPSPNYTIGTVTVTAGSPTVQGAGTSWDLSLVTGGLFCAQGLSVPIASVTDDDTLVLALNWPGTSASGMAYAILLLTAEAADAIEANAYLAEIAYRMRSGTFLQPNATGTLAQRAAYNTEAQGFIFIQSDVTPFRVFIKESATSGDWSNYTELVGVTGAAGAPGSDGIGDYYDLAFEANGRPGTGETFRRIFARSVTFPLNFASSRAIADAASTGTAVWSIKKNGVAICTITFTASVTGVFSGAGGTFNAGDIFELVAPDPRDATLSNILATFAGNRVP